MPKQIVTKTVTETGNKKQPRRRRPRRKKSNGKPSTTIVAPTSKTVVVRSGVPNIRTSNATTRVRHREYIQDITAADSAFRAGGLSVNPGLAVTFPWLSPQAARYESYIFHSLHFIYEPVVNTSVSGSVMLAIDFDAGDAAPANKTNMMANQSAVRTSVWNEVTYNATQKNLKKFGVQRYIRTGPTSNNQDIKTFDVGTLYVASQGTPTTSTTLGELYVEYDVELFTPQIQTNAAFSNQRQQQTTITWVNGAVSLAAYIQDATQPLMFLQDGTNGFNTMALNLEQAEAFIMNARATGTGSAFPIAGLMQSYDNLRFNEQLAESWDIRALAKQAGGIISSSNVSYVAQWIARTASTKVNSGGASTLGKIFHAAPFVLRPNSGANGRLDLGLIPIATDIPTEDTWLPTTGVDFAGFEIVVPNFTFLAARGLKGRVATVYGKNVTNTFYDNWDDYVAAIGPAKK